MTRWALAALLLIGGCGTSAPTASNPIGVATPRTPPGHPGVSLGDEDIGRTSTVVVGQLVTVKLTGTDWKFLDPKPAGVLTPASPPVVSGNSVAIIYRGARPGTATASARRGEDAFQITVIVQ